MKLLNFKISKLQNLYVMDLLQKIKNSINKIDPFVKIILYGSRARGDFKKKSDWDILILTDKDEFLRQEDKFRDKLYDIELETNEIISLQVYSKKYWKQKLKITPFYQNIINEGIEL